MNKRLVLSVVIDNEKQYIDLDTISNVSVNLNSVVSTYPLVEGDSISDHMYREPAIITISGTFGQKGRFAINNTSENRLKDLQALFERIKDERLFVDILSIYNVRPNFVLQNISWTEHANTLDYTFSFKEIYTAKVEEIEYEVDITDENLPTLTEPLQLDFTDTLLDWEEVDKLVILALKDAKLVDDEFLQGVAASIGFIAGGAALSGLTIAIAVATSTLSIPVVGWVVGGLALVGTGIYAAITTSKKSKAKKNYRIKAFENYKDDRKKQAEYERFVNFMGEIHKQLEVLEYSAKAYGLAANTNQECVINIDGTYYIFNFEKNNSTGYWSMVVKNIKHEVIKEVSSMVGLASIAEATSHNNLFASETGSQVYLINTKLAEAEIYGDSDNIKYYNDLTNFVFFVTAIDMNNWNNLIIDIINNALKV